MPSTSQNTNLNYYPFGSAFESRAFASGGYRFGFGVHEKDDEIKGSGNHLNFGDYGYDPRTGRRWNVDPMSRKIPFASPYAYCLNNPILMFDAGGEYPFTVHIRSYHPNEAFGSFGMGKGYHGDNRGFSLSTASDVTARVTQKFIFDVAKGTINYDKKNGTWSNETKDFKGNKETATPTGQVSEMNKSGNIGTFNSSFAANNPLVSGSPDIDVKANFTVLENTEKGILIINMNASGDDFPNTEAFLTDASGQSVFMGVDVREAGNDAAPFILAGGATTPIMNNIFSITLDKKGNFKNVYSGGEKYSLDDWNKKFTSIDAEKTD